MPNIDIPFPIGGLHRRNPYSHQEPHTTADCLNVRPVAAIEGRHRGGTRPGLGYLSTFGELGAPSPVRLLNSVQHIGEDGRTNIYDDFKGSSLAANWSLPAWANAVLPVVAPELRTATGSPIDGLTVPAYYAMGGLGVNATIAAGPGFHTTNGESPTYGADYESISGIDTTEDYQVEMLCVPYAATTTNGTSQFFQGKYQLFLLMDDGTPNVKADGILVELIMDTKVGAYSGTAKVYESSSVTATYTFASSSTGASDPGWLRAFINETNETLTITWKDITLVNAQSLVGRSFQGSRTGFGLQPTGHEVSVSGNFALPDIYVDTFRVQWVSTTLDLERNQGLVASSNAILYHEGKTEDQFDVIGGNVDLNSAEPLQSVESGGSLYIADWDKPRRESATGVATTTNLDDINVASWDALNIDPDNDVVVIFKVDADATLIPDTYTITSVHDTLGLTLDWTTQGSSSPCRYSIQRAPKVFDPSTQTLSILSANQAYASITNPNGAPYVVTTAQDHGLFDGQAVFLYGDGALSAVNGNSFTITNTTDKTFELSGSEGDGGAAGTGGRFNTGQVPTGNPLLTRYQDCLVWGGALDSPNVWFMSRQSRPTDYNYGDSIEDPQRAVAGNNSQAGIVGQPLTAFVVFSDDYFVMATASELWLLRGHPAGGGIIDSISRTIGIVSPWAWCHGEVGDIYFLARNGVHRMLPGSGQYPQNISLDPLPESLLGFDPDKRYAFMAFDLRNRGYHLFTTVKLEADAVEDGQEHFWIDQKTLTFWPVRVPTSIEPTYVYSRTEKSANKAITIFGCRDGKLRTFSFDYTVDSDSSNTAITCHVDFGPIGISDNRDHDSLITEIRAHMAILSDNVTWELYTAETEDDVQNEVTADATGTLPPGRSQRFHPRQRGGAFKVRLKSTSGRWAFERMRLEIEQQGIARDES